MAEKKVAGAGLSREELRRWIEPDHQRLSVARQCELLGLPRSTCYYGPAGETAENLALMRRIDEQYSQTPFYGSRKLALTLQVNRKRVQRLMRMMGIEAIYPRRRHDPAGRRAQDLPVFTAECGGHAARPGVVQRHHVRAAAARVLVPGGGAGLVQPVRAELAAVEHAGGELLLRGAGGGALAVAAGDLQQRSREPVHGGAFTRRLEAHGVAISMDGRGRALDNVFIERLWRSVKYEEVYLRDYADGWEAQAPLGRYFEFYCQRRIHQSLGYRTPAAVYGVKGSSR